MNNKYPPPFSIKLSTKENTEYSNHLSEKLFQFNCKARGDDYSGLNVLLFDGNGEIFGGLIGWHRWGWAHIDCLWVDDQFRNMGFGLMLMEVAEAEFIKRQCKFCDLDTFNFQAPEFYQKLGYSIIFELDIDEQGTKKIFLKKTLST